jgi:Arc/MetJ-type ribon-helix-helix transcriptional regulator
METEKVCVNLSAAELGAIDVLVAKGLFTTRSDVIRAGVREVMEQHQVTLNRVSETATTIGLIWVLKRDLEKAVREGKRLRFFVVGILRIDKGVTPELADQAIEHIQVLGSLRATPEVLERLGDRISRNLDGTGWL